MGGLRQRWRRRAHNHNLLNSNYRREGSESRKQLGWAVCSRSREFGSKLKSTTVTDNLIQFPLFKCRSANFALWVHSPGYSASSLNATRTFTAMNAIAQQRDYKWLTTKANERINEHKLFSDIFCLHYYFRGKFYCTQFCCFNEYAFYLL